MARLDNILIGITLNKKDLCDVKRELKILKKMLIDINKLKDKLYSRKNRRKK